MLLLLLACAPAPIPGTDVRVSPDATRFSSSRFDGTYVQGDVELVVGNGGFHVAGRNYYDVLGPWSGRVQDVEKLLTPLTGPDGSIHAYDNCTGTIVWDEGDSPYLSHDNVLSISVRETPACAPLEGVWLAKPPTPSTLRRGTCSPLVDCVCQTATLLQDRGLMDSCTELRALERTDPDDPMCVSGGQLISQVASELALAQGKQPASACVTVE